MTKLEIHYDPNSSWAALYIDGTLDPSTVGDSYHAEQRAFELTGVTVVQDDAFLRGQYDHAGCAQTLAEVAEYRAIRDERETAAAELRSRAKELLAQAERIESGGDSR